MKHMLRPFKKFAVLAAVLATAFAAHTSRAEVSTEDLVNPDDATDVWGRKISGLGDNGDETALVFTKTGTTMNWTLPDGVSTIWYLVVGGGGSGATCTYSGGSSCGGGNGGSVVESTVLVASKATLAVTVGAGGSRPASTAAGTSGAASTLAYGGDQPITANGGSGGSLVYKTATSGGKGGDGAGTKGQEGGTNTGGCGGDGVSTTIADLTGLVAAGGGGGGTGGSNTSYTGGAGGTTGGGKGGTCYNGATQTQGGDGSYYGAGGGGSGSRNKGTGGAGYQGIVVVRYRVTAADVVEVPMIDSKVYTGEKQTADVPESDKYTVTANDGGTNAGDYPVTLTLASGYKWYGGSTEPTNLTFMITKAENSWTTDPSIVPDSWSYGSTAGTVSKGGTLSDAEIVVTYDDDLTEMPVTVGTHTAHFTVPEGQNHLAITTPKDVTYTVALRTNSWTVEPSVTPNNWAVSGTAGAVNSGTAASGIAPVVTYDNGLDEMPTSAGVHKAVFTVAEGNNYAGIVREVGFLITSTAVAEDIGMATVTLSGYEGTETLTNFPVLVRFSAERFPGVNVDFLSEDGADVRVTDLNGNELAFEIENWDRAGESLIWVKIPELKPTSEIETSVIVLWGKTAERVTLPKDVWTEYAAVFHMNTTDLTAADVTGNGYDVYGSGTLTNGPAGKAIQHSQSLAMNDFVCGEGGIGSNYTISCWFKYPSWDGSGAVTVLGKGAWKTNGRWYTQYKGSYEKMGLVGDYGVRGSIATKDVRTEWNYYSIKNSGGTLSANANGAAWTTFWTLVSEDDYNLTINGTQVDELRIMKSAASGDWVRADYRSQTGELSSAAFIRNPIYGDVIVQHSTETEPSVDNDRTLTIPYRVVSTGGSAVDVHVLYAIEGDATTNDLVAATGRPAMEEDDTVTVADLRPGTNYVFAIYGQNQAGVKSETMSWKTISVPGAPVFSGFVRSQTKTAVTLSGVVGGANAKTATLRYRFGDADWSELALSLDADGAFEVTLDRTSPTDVLAWKVVAASHLDSATWGTFDWDAESAEQTTADTSAVTYTWTGSASDEWNDPANWMANSASSYGYPNSSNATAVFSKVASVNLAGAEIRLATGGLRFAADLGESVVISNGTLKVAKSANADMGASGTTVDFRDLAFESAWIGPVGGATFVFSGKTSVSGRVRPWGVALQKLVFRDGEMTVGYFEGYCNSADNGNDLLVSNAVVTVTDVNNGGNRINGRPYRFIDGDDREAQIIATGKSAKLLLSGDYEVTLRAGGRTLPVLQSPTCNPDSAGYAFRIDATLWERGKKVPLVKFTGADQSDAMTNKVGIVTAYANGVDVTAKRNARLEWSAVDNALYYKQDGQFGLMLLVR